ncbi:pilus assembly protein [Boseaceae bacterium BT-24-1]|nr:pilus assembly protein [Boseaceae bacterium BT-24-1]
MSKGLAFQLNPRRLIARLGVFRRDVAGSTAVEFAFIGMAFITLSLGIIQFALVFMAQMYLHDAVSEAATGKTTATYAGNRSEAVNQICARMFVLDSCATKLALEAQPLASYSTAQQAISGTVFVAAVVGTPMLMRAKAPVVTFVPGLPQLSISATALYARRS